jgi:predicted nucleotidyltransferase
MSDTIFMIDFKKFKPEIERVCRALPVKRLGVFGSALTQEFGAHTKIICRSWLKKSREY